MDQFVFVIERPPILFYPNAGTVMSIFNSPVDQASRHPVKVSILNPSDI